MDFKSKKILFDLIKI